jgi:multiple sugar transport system substrate-binding protein
MHTRWTRFSIPFVALVLVVAACGGSATPPPSVAAPSVAPPSVAAPTGTPVTAATGTPAAETPTVTAPTETTPPTETTSPTETTPPGETTSPSETPAITPAPTPFGLQPSNVPAGAVVVRWFCCLGAGDAPEQVAVEDAVVQKFNATHTDIQIAFEGIPYSGARDALATEIAAGNAPDIVGPVGIGGANAFNDQWLDLTQLIKSNNYDLKQYQGGAVDFYKIGKTQNAIPFAIYPSSLFYQRSQFSEIQLSEPPHKYGDPYTVTGAKGTALFGVAEGATVPWNYDTVNKLSMLLTVDVNGKDATEDGFDPTQITQYGFEAQRDDLRGMGAYFGAGQLAGGADGKTVQIPAAWEAAWKFFYDGIYTQHTIMDGPTFQSQEFNGGGYPFCSGKVAMQPNFLWSKYCLSTAGTNWDLAAIPAWQNNEPSAAFNADTFRIIKTSKNPDAAFKAMTYLEGDASVDLLQTYGGMPARPDAQAAFFDAINAADCCKADSPPPDWSVAKAGVNHSDNPNFESFMPAYNQSLDILNTYLTKWQTTPGLDMDAEIAALKAALQTAWDANPTP